MYMSLFIQHFLILFILNIVYRIFFHNTFHISWLLFLYFHHLTVQSKSPHYLNCLQSWFSFQLFYSFHLLFILYFCFKLLSNSCSLFYLMFLKLDYLTFCTLLFDNQIYKYVAHFQYLNYFQLFLQNTDVRLKYSHNLNNWLHMIQTQIKSFQIFWK